MDQEIGVTDYFDSSALVKRYLAERGSDWVQARCNDLTRTIVTVELGRVEIAAAFASKLRGQFITQTEYQSLRTKLATDTQQQYQLISLASQHVDEAIELTARHKLRGYDAVHLACALYLNRLLLDSGFPPLTFVASDQDLLQAAQAEGLAVDDPSDYP